jgi:membrane-associated phospholipid phosphatase
MDLEKILISMPLILLVGSAIYGITESDNNLLALSVGILFCIIIANFFKSLMPKPPIDEPDYLRANNIYIRPTNDPCKCKMQPNSCLGEIGIGMPSAHATVMSFFFFMIFFRMMVINIKVIIAFILALVVIGQRYVSKCHTILQLMVGSILGFVLAMIYNFSLNKIGIN